MANTFIKIQTQTVGSGGVASVTFSSIPQTYTDLKLVVSARGNEGADVSSPVFITFNGSATGYSERLLYTSGGAPASASTSAVARFQFALYIDGPASTANTFGNGEIYIPNYAGASNKSISADYVLENNATATFLALDAGLWANTDAITSITLLHYATGNFVQHSTFSLYGIKKN